MKQLQSDTILCAGYLLREQLQARGFRFFESLPAEDETRDAARARVRAQAVALGRSWWILRIKGVNPLRQFATSRDGMSWIWRMNFDPSYVEALRAEFNKTTGDPFPMSQTKLRKIFYGDRTRERGHPLEGPDMIVVVAECRERGLPLDHYLNAAEVEQFEAFASGATDEELAARWIPLSVAAVRQRRSRIRKKLSQIVERYMEVNNMPVAETPTLVQRVTALEERLEDQKSQLAELARQVGVEFDNNAVTEAVEQFLEDIDQKGQA